MVLIKGTGRGKCTCGTPTEIEMQNIRDASEEAVREAREALRIAGDADDNADNAQERIDDIESGITIVGRANYSAGSTNSIYSQYAKQLNNSIKHQQISVLSGTADVWHWGKIVMVSLRNLTIPPGTTEMLRGQIPIPHRTDPPASIVCISYGRIGVNDSSDYAELEIRTIYDGTTKGYIDVTTRGSGNCTGSATLIYMSFYDSEHE